MSQVSSKLRRCETGYLHWCPACEELHILPDTWTFDGNLETPTFGIGMPRPSFRHWDNAGWVCHYVLTNGMLSYCSDCSHTLAGKITHLPELPDHAKDLLPFQKASE